MKLWAEFGLQIPCLAPGNKYKQKLCNNSVHACKFPDKTALNSDFKEIPNVTCNKWIIQ